MQIERLGPYKIGRKLGRGGMGTVYQGLILETGEVAAIKVLSAAMSLDEGFRERFEAEIDTLKKLRHPNIVRLLAWGEEHGLLFYAMELVAGSSLEDELQAGRRYDWRETTHIGIKLSRALKHAHDHGVIHRDIKPANLLTTGDEVKLSDFGIAKLFGNMGLTADGGVIGTAEYMSPEQADGRPVTYRSDLYSLGSVLYALLARRPPFKAKSVPEMLQLQRFAIPDPVERFCPDVPRELSDIIDQLLAKDPEKRITNAMILARRLESMEHGLAVKLNRLQQTVADDGDLPPGGPSMAPGPVDPLAATKADADVLARRSVALHAGPPAGVGETQATASSDPSPAVSISMAEAPAQPVPPPKFITVEEEEQAERATYRETLSELVSPQTWALVAALLIVGLGALYLMQPPSADALYERISAAAAQESDDRLVEAEDDVLEFLKHYADDDRSREMEGYRDAIERIRMERQYERRAKRREDASQLSPVEAAYAEAMQVARIDPAEGADRLHALLTLYDDQTNADRGTDNVSLCLRLARSKYDRLRRQAESYIADNLALVQSRLEEAEELSEPSPDEAREILQSIVTLYRHKPWAQDAVQKAESRLATLNAESPPSASEGP
jgi:serine/threonine-protein kinase